jgi:hypothetical protein
MTIQPAPINMVRLTPEVYLDLEKKFKGPLVTDSTSPTQAGYQLGIQAVLYALRSGYVVSPS